MLSKKISKLNPRTFFCVFHAQSLSNFGEKHPEFRELGDVVDVTVRDPGTRTQGSKVGENPFPRLLDLIRNDEAGRAGGQTAGPKQVLEAIGGNLRGLANRKV